MVGSAPESSIFESNTLRLEPQAIWLCSIIPPSSWKVLDCESAPLFEERTAENGYLKCLSNIDPGEVQVRYIWGSGAFDVLDDGVVIGTSELRK